MLSVKDYGALGNGTPDDTAAINAALAAGERDIAIPAGTYLISDTLLVPSHRHIHADKEARLILISTAPMVQEQFLISNADPLYGNTDIVLEGGTWDGGCGHKYNVKNPDLFARNANSGACINFVGVKAAAEPRFEV